MKKSAFNRLISLILLLATVIGLLPLNVIALDGAETDTAPSTSQTTEDTTCHCGGVSVLYNGAEHRVINLPIDGDAELSLFVIGEEPTDISWQIATPDGERWIKIYGKSGESLSVTYALVASMLNERDSAFIRAEVKHGGARCASEPVEIKISHVTDEEVAVATEEAPMLFSMRSLSRAVDGGDGEDEDEETFETFNIVINYIFDDGRLAFEPYGASVAKGSSFVKVGDDAIISPNVAGYKPVRRVGDSYVDATKLELNYTNIQEDITLNVIYEPDIVGYQVHHHLQDLYDDGYSIQPDRITYGQGLTGTMVPDGIELSEEELPGFYHLDYVCLEIAADGTTVIEIRYARRYYFVDFDMQGGYGVEPLYLKYGTEVGANIPIKHGYVFDKWQLVEYGDAAPSAEQLLNYDINSNIITVPDADLCYRAIWITQLVNYTMVFWAENANDDGFSYWGSLNNLKAMSGSFVSGEDRVDEVSYIDDEQHFTYMESITDKNVLVEGDGSTVVNVYYARNRYTIQFKATGLCKIPEKHTHGDSCYTLLCDKGHVHTDDCVATLSCTVPVHTEHTADCTICGYQDHTHGSNCCNVAIHTHVKSCYNNVGSASTPSGAPTNVVDGYIFAVASTSWWQTNYTYYIHIAGAWYRYNGWGVSSGDIVDSKCGYKPHTHGTDDCPCALPEHTHSDECYSDTLHEHDPNACYTYSCNAEGHVHTDGCYVLDCGIPLNHTHTTTGSNNCMKSSSTNVVKIVTRKYLADLGSMWPIVDDNGKTYDSGERWSPKDSSYYSQVLVYIANMPGDDFTLSVDLGTDRPTYTINYYIEVLDGEEHSKTYGEKKFKLYKTIKANYNHLTEAEDYFDIYGFYKYGADPKFTSGKIDTNGGTVNLYYGRVVDHYLKFQSNGEILDDHTVHGLPYGSSLKGYDFVPEYPATLEPGAYNFAGWYTTPDHFDGTEVNWDTLSMDEGDVLLYAKWSPTVHTVEVYLDSTLDQQIGSTQHVNHGSFAAMPTETVEKGEYFFIGWFYTNKDGVEKAFVFTGIPIIDDLKIYAKWSSHVAVTYTINYVYYEQNDETGTPIVIADPTTGPAIAGNNMTFYAKAGEELYSKYQTGYYPKTSSHTITMSAETLNHEFTFVYEYVESMPYMVKYVDESGNLLNLYDANGNSIANPKRVMDNTLSVVTETFVKVSGMMPDSYQKRLVLSNDKTDSDGDGIYDSNVIVFNYKSDTEHAYYKVVHYIENLHGNGYREYRSEDLVGVIGQQYTISPITLTGFSYKEDLTTVNGEYYTPATSGGVTAELTADGLLIELYYNRVQYKYVVRYLESGTRKVLYEREDADDLMGIFGEQIVEYAVGLTHLGYGLVSDSVKQINISANSEQNVIEFFYTENSYAIRYQLVSQSTETSLSQTLERVTAVSGNAGGSRFNYIEKGYHFVGWFTDAACTIPAPAEWIDENYAIKPVRDGIWLGDHTYYAKVDPDYTDLTIKTVGVADVDAGEIFIFHIKGMSEECADVDLKVTVVGNSSVTVTHLPVGEYSVSELVGWAYRYTPDSIIKTLNISFDVMSDNSVTFSHLRTNVNWLDGNDNKYNVYD